MKKYNIVMEESVFKTPRMEAVKRTLRSEDSSSEFTDTIIKSEPSIATIIRNEYGKIAFKRMLCSPVNQFFIEIPVGVKCPCEESMWTVAFRHVRQLGFFVENVRILVNGPSLLDPSMSDKDFGVAEAEVCAQKSRCCLDENKWLIWIDEADVFVRLHEQIAEGKPFYDGLYLSGHTMYALLAYSFFKNY